MEKNLITVTKTATEFVDADTVTISLRITGEDKKYARAVSAADRIADGVVAALAALPVKPKVRARGIAVSPRSDKKDGYTAVRSYSVEFDYSCDALNAVLDALADYPAEQNVSFSHKGETDRLALVTRAVKAARADADCIAAAAGVKISKLHSAEYSSHGGAPMLMRAAAFSNSAEPEQITLSETVTCSWETE